MITEPLRVKPAPPPDFDGGIKKPVMALMSLYSYESLGIRYLASSLRRAGHTCLELFYEDLRRNHFRYPSAEELDGVVAILRQNGADILGLSVRSSYYRLAAMITDHVRRELGVPVIWGSAHATICPEDSLKHADAVCLGEGEKSLVEFMDSFSGGGGFTKTPGFWFKTREGEIIRNGRRAYENLDDLPDPEFDAPGKFHSRGGVWREGDPQWNEGAFTIMSSRGCPHACSFCSNHFFMKAGGNFLRLRSVDRVIGEIRRAREKMPNIRRVKFYDDLFATNKKWTDEFVEKYKREIGLPFDALLNPQHVTPSLMRKLTYAGLTLVEMGVQSGSERMANEVYDRRLSNEKLARAVKTLHESGVRATYDIILDNPLETPEDKRANFEFMLGVPRPFSLLAVSLIHLPGTALTRRLLDTGLIRESDVEGNSDKSLFQWEASLNYPRPPEDAYWLALMSLLTKDFVPKWFIRFLYGRKFLMGRPRPLLAIAWVANVMKFAQLAVVLYREGSLTMQVIRRHANLRNLAVK